VPNDAVLTDGSVQGNNSWGTLGYRGPCPPSGSTHRYFFKLYALDTELGLASGATKTELLNAMDGHILYQTELMGTYQR
jgi:Raf kinase inhibitor-like YbhB/YbcL family protein